MSTGANADLLGCTENLRAAYRPDDVDIILFEVRIRLAKSHSCVFLSAIRGEWTS